MIPKGKTASREMPVGTYFCCCLLETNSSVPAMAMPLTQIPGPASVGASASVFISAPLYAEAAFTSLWLHVEELAFSFLDAAFCS